jgi:hypothetical protein
MVTEVILFSENELQRFIQALVEVGREIVIEVRVCFTPVQGSRILPGLVEAVDF